MKTIRILLVAALAAVLVALGAAPASAHAALVSSDPADGETLATAPEAAVLEFSEAIDAPSTQIALTDGTGGTVPTGDVTADGPKVTVPLSITAAGTYVLGYRIVSEDGHRVDGSITFQVQKASGPSSDVPEPVGTGSSAAEVAPVAGSDEPDGGGNGALWVIALGGVVAVAIIGFVVLRRKKPTGED